MQRTDYSAVEKLAALKYYVSVGASDICTLVCNVSSCPTSLYVRLAACTKKLGSFVSGKLTLQKTWLHVSGRVGSLSGSIQMVQLASPPVGLSGPALAGPQPGSDIVPLRRALLTV